MIRSFSSDISIIDVHACFRIKIIIHAPYELFNYRIGNFLIETGGNFFFLSFSFLVVEMQETLLDELIFNKSSQNSYYLRRSFATNRRIVFLKGEVNLKGKKERCEDTFDKRNYNFLFSKRERKRERERDRISLNTHEELFEHLVTRYSIQVLNQFSVFVERLSRYLKKLRFLFQVCTMFMYLNRIKLNYSYRFFLSFSFFFFRTNKPRMKQVFFFST